MFQLVSWHCKSQTAWVRWLPICCAFIAKFIILGLMFNKKEWQVVKSVQSWCNTLLTHLYRCKAQTWKEHKCFSPLRPWGTAFKHAFWLWTVLPLHDSVELLCHSKFFFPSLWSLLVNLEHQISKDESLVFVLKNVGRRCLVVGCFACSGLTGEELV